MALVLLAVSVNALLWFVFVSDRVSAQNKPREEETSPIRRSASPAKSDSSSGSEKSPGEKRKKSKSRSSSRSSSSSAASHRKSHASSGHSSSSDEDADAKKGRSRSRSVSSDSSAKARQSSSDVKHSQTPERSPVKKADKDRSGSDSEHDVMSIPLPESQIKSQTGSKTGTPAGSVPSRQASVKRSPSPRQRSKSKSRSASKSPDARKRSRTPRRYRSAFCLLLQCVQKKRSKYLLWNLGDSNKMWYTVSWINLPQNDINVIHLTGIMSLHYLVYIIFQQIYTGNGVPDFIKIAQVLLEILQ